MRRRPRQPCRERWRRRLEVLPLFKVHDTLTLATGDPQAIPVQDEIRELTGLKLRLVLAGREEILKHQIDAYSGNGLDPELVEFAATDIALVERRGIGPSPRSTRWPVAARSSIWSMA